MMCRRPGDWRDSWPTLPGKTVVRTVLADFAAPRTLTCTHLKFEDAGVIASLGNGL
jgi:hypothetical protein